MPAEEMQGLRATVCTHQAHGSPDLLAANTKVQENFFSRGAILPRAVGILDRISGASFRIEALGGSIRVAFLANLATVFVSELVAETNVLQNHRRCQPERRLWLQQCRHWFLGWLRKSVPLLRLEAIPGL